MDDWIFIEETGRLRRPERTVQLTPKAAAVLACLRRHQGAVVGVKQIVEDVWRGIDVSPDLVREYVHDLRKALGDDARDPRMIETVRGRGFRLKRAIAVGKEDGLPKASAEQRPARPIIAVLKPVVFGGDTASTIGDAVVSDIINQLARFQDIAVMARQSSILAEQVTDLLAFTRDLGVSYVLESSVGVVADRIRVRVQLVDGATARALWADSYDFDPTDMLAAIDHTVEAVVGALTGWNGELHRAAFVKASARPPEQRGAYEHFILGRDIDVVFDKTSMARSIWHL